MALTTRVPPPNRTEGDGMEFSPDQNILPAEENLSESLSRLNLTPMKPCVMKAKKKAATLPYRARAKEPKFVPFEPYKAAVRPLVPKKKRSISQSRSPINECDSAESSRRPSVTTSIDFERKSASAENLPELCCQQFNEEVTKLRTENEELEKELKMQVQINGELRHLLVASVGEDVETRVTILAEDKRHLAQKLLNTAKNLSSHHEQIEWLASQCEVWRSKFLASSVMVEELARWKATLSHKVTEAENVLRSMLDDRRSVRKNLLSLYSNLLTLRDSFHLLGTRSILPSSNILDLSTECLKLSNELVMSLLNEKPRDSSTTPTELLQSLPPLTAAEESAEYMLKHPHPLNLIKEPDAACSAVVGAAVALNSQLYHLSNPPKISCCAQCTGQIKLV